MISHGDDRPCPAGQQQRVLPGFGCPGWTGRYCRQMPDLPRVHPHGDLLPAPHPVFRRRRFFDGEPIRTGDQIRDIAWLTPAGTEMTHDDWWSGFRGVPCFNGQAILAPRPAGRTRGRRFIPHVLPARRRVAFWSDFVTPAGEYAQQWTAEFDTFDPQGRLESHCRRRRQGHGCPRSILVLRKTG